MHETLAHYIMQAWTDPGIKLPEKGKNEAKTSSKTEGRRYTEQIKQFAVSLHFYSPKHINL